MIYYKFLEFSFKIKPSIQIINIQKKSRNLIKINVMKIVAQSTILVEIEILKAKLASEGIQSYIKNEFVNNVVVMPINQDYFLLVNDEDFEKATIILNNPEEEIN